MAAKEVRYFLLNLDDSFTEVFDALAWSKRYPETARRGWVASDRLDDGFWVTTEFTGVVSLAPDESPLFWVTSVGHFPFGLHPDIEDCNYARCSTRVEAIEQHARVLADVKQHLAKCPGGCPGPTWKHRQTEPSWAGWIPTEGWG